MSDTPEPKWGWWVGDGERYHDGPYLTKEDATAEAEVGEIVAECLSNYIDLSQWFDAQDWLDRVLDSMEDENAPSESGNHPLDELTLDQTADLEKRVRAAIAAWQVAHDLPLRTYYFKATRNEHTVKEDEHE